MPNHQLIHENILFLRQGIDLLQQVDDEMYAMTVAPYFNSGVGKHIRHNLDHYEMFLLGLAGNAIDYDGRQRDARVETERPYAIEKMLTIIVRLEALARQKLDRSVFVKMNDTDEKNRSPQWSQSSVARELQFLLSHTVYHYALIAVILKIQGFDCRPDFGVAPSTLKYQRSRQA
jgi:hypothetical protein